MADGMDKSYIQGLSLDNEPCSSEEEPLLIQGEALEETVSAILKDVPEEDFSAFSAETAEDTVNQESTERVVLERMRWRRELKPLYLYCEELKKISEGLDRQLFMELMTDRVMLLSVNLGAGVNGFSAMYFDFLREEGLLPGEGGGAEIRLDETGEQGLSLTDARRFILESGGTLFSIDLTSWVEEIEAEKLRDFLRFLYAQAEGFRYVFRIPYIEKQTLKRVAAILSDMFTVDIISLPPVRQQDIRETAAAYLSDYGCTATEEAMELFERRLSEERSDGRFYGMNTVEKVIREMVVEKLRKGKPNEEECLIYAADIENILSEELKEESNPDLELRSRVGMEEICEQLLKIIKDMEQAKGGGYFNICFAGNPGTGRTEAARLFGEMMKSRGMLTRGGFLEYRGDELVGTIPGETVPKTMTICRDAEGCVLFIDGLSLKDRSREDREDEDKRDKPDYRREAIEALLSQLRQEAGSFLLIFAGSEEEIRQLYTEYPELSTLMPYTVHFRDYSKAELMEIYLDMARREGFRLDDNALTVLKEYFDRLPLFVLKEEAFANGRFVRNLFERSRSTVAMRAELYSSDAHTIMEGDLRIAMSGDTALLNRREVKKYPMGFRLRDL